MQKEKIASKLKALAVSRDGEDRKTWTVLYWKSQGLTHLQISGIVERSVEWVQRYSSRTYLVFEIKDWGNEEKEIWLLQELLPVMQELTKTDPYLFTVPVKLPPEPSKGPVTPVTPIKDTDSPPDKPETDSKLFPPKPTVITVNPQRRPRYGRLVLLAVFICVLVSVVGYGAYSFGRNSLVLPTPLPTVVQIITTTSIPPPIETPTQYPLPTDTPTNTNTPIPPTPEFYEAGKWILLNGTLYVRLSDDLYSMPDCRPKPQEFAVELQFHNDNGQYLLRYDPSSFQAMDDTGKTYKLLGAGHVFCNEIGIQNIDIKRGDSHITLLFAGSFPLEAKYLIITADSINGVRLVFHKSL